MLLWHVVPNNCAPFAFDAITYASATLDRLLAGVKVRRFPCHDRAAIMDARKTWLIPVGGGCPETPIYFNAEKAVGVRTWLLMLATIGPSRSPSSRTLCQAESLRNAVHLVSRSASDSHWR